MLRVLISGSAGFVGHNLVSYILEKTDWEIISVDRLNSATSQKRWNELEFESNPRIKLINIVLGTDVLKTKLHSIGDLDYIFHLGAETDVNKSVNNPLPFISSNIQGTFELLELARLQPRLKYFVYFSTSDVFGYSKQTQKYKEWSNYNSLNPYSASKAAGEELSLAYSTSYQIPIMIIHTMNIFGNREDPRKFIPRTVYSIIKGVKLPIFTNSNEIVGSRSYIHTSSFISALFFLLDLAKSNPNNSQSDWFRNKFNIAGENIIDNLSLATKIASILGMPLNYKLLDYYSDHPTHNLHSALDCTKISTLGWFPDENFEDQLRKTIIWLENNPNWLETFNCVF